MHRSGLTVPVLLALGLAIGAAPVSAKPRSACAETALDLLGACNHDVRDELLTTKAQCLNLADPDERASCNDDALSERSDNRQLCRDQYEARVDFCKALGEDRYDPEVDPASYDGDFENPSNPNLYYPLRTGDYWDYQSAQETDHVEVLDKTKQIQGVTCAVVSDVVKEDDVVTEDTQDWIAHRLDGAAQYFGELAKDFETFDGDDPEEPELVDIEGSFKAGRDGAKHGTLFLASPAVGTVYREEWALTDAEDGARVVSTTYGYGSDTELDQHVPQALAEHLCSGDCVVTENFTPLEPDTLERKFYAPGVGLWLEVDLGSGDVNRLVGCNVDSRCANLP